MLGYPVLYASLDQSLSNNLGSGGSHTYIGKWQNAKSRVAFFDYLHVQRVALSICTRSVHVYVT